MCDCRTRLNEKLAPLNARLAYGFTFGSARTMELSPPLIELEKIEKRGKKPPVLLASFCPFCGEKYDDDAALSSGKHGGEA